MLATASDRQIVVYVGTCKALFLAFIFMQTLIDLFSLWVTCAASAVHPLVSFPRSILRGSLE
jgi:hypothetical protein